MKNWRMVELVLPGEVSLKLNCLQSIPQFFAMFYCHHITDWKEKRTCRTIRFFRWTHAIVVLLVIFTIISSTIIYTTDEWRSTFNSEWHASRGLSLIFRPFPLITTSSTEMSLHIKTRQVGPKVEFGLLPRGGQFSKVSCLKPLLDSPTRQEGA